MTRFIRALFTRRPHMDDTIETLAVGAMNAHHARFGPETLRRMDGDWEI